jgi:hypothetical protein
VNIPRKITFEISFSEKFPSVLSKMCFHLKIEINKTTDKMHLKHVVDLLANTLSSLPCMG